eukprot:CCRYP_017825-RA/>CCRYP_017825-RA protein AED:0.49 eAED:0.29 QI:0/0/0/1/1/1/2/0/96
MDVEDEFDPDKHVRKYTLHYPGQVLVRLKVEHSGFTTMSNQRFGSRFVGEALLSVTPVQSLISRCQANPSDILLFRKKHQAENATTKDGAAKKKQT